MKNKNLKGKFTWRIAVVVFIINALTACGGTGLTSSSSSSSSSSGGSSGYASNSSSSSSSSSSSGIPSYSSAVKLRRLNNTEYNNSIRDLFNTSLTPADNFPRDLLEHNYANQGGAQEMSAAHVRFLLDASDDVISEALNSDNPELTCPQQGSNCYHFVDGVNTSGNTWNCAATVNESCARTIVTNMGKRIWRRPLTTDEIETYVSLFHTGAPSPGTTYFPQAAGMKQALRGLLMSPNFLYRPEIDLDLNATQAHPLNAYELASRLSYFIWASTPDEELLAAADNNSLLNDNVLSAQVTRMLASPKAESLVDDFARRWLRYDALRSSPDPILYPNYRASLRESVINETRSFMHELLLNKNAPLTEILTADYTFMNGPLKSFFSVNEINVPIIIQAENYSAAFDTTAANLGNTANFSKGVDVQKTTDEGGGFNVGYIEAGEWLEYKIDVLNTGLYDVSMRFAALAAGGQFKISVNNISTQVVINVPTTGGYQIWNTFGAIDALNLNAGLNTIRLQIIKGNFNLNWFGLSIAGHIDSAKDFVRTQWQLSDHRQGILAHASILMPQLGRKSSSITQRGLWISNTLLCQELAAAPLVFNPTGPGATESTRAYLERVYSAGGPDCRSCHDALYPQGYALDNYDAVGQWRTEETRNIPAPGSWPIDASGQLISGERFDGPIELSNVLAASPEVSLCITSQLMTYGLGRFISPSQSRISPLEYDDINRIYNSTAATGHRYQDIIKAIILSDLFRQRIGADAQDKAL